MREFCLVLPAVCADTTLALRDRLEPSSYRKPFTPPLALLESPRNPSTSLIFYLQ